MQKYNEYKQKINQILDKYNISIDTDTLLKEIEISNRNFNDVYDTFLLKYSDQYGVLSALYNKTYPYDLELNCQTEFFEKLGCVSYDMKNQNFYGLKFKKSVNKQIVDYLTNTNCLVKGLMVDIKYDLEHMMSFLNRTKIDLDLKYLTDNIYNIYIVLGESTPLINKIALYEVYKVLKGPKAISHSFIYTKSSKISILNNKFIEKFYDKILTKEISDISYCIREYLDRNGYLIHFNTFLVDCISLLIYIQNKKMYSVPNILKSFLRFKYTGISLNADKEEYSKIDEELMILYIDNGKYILRYPNQDILKRLKYFNKAVYERYYTKIGTCYSFNRNINSQLSFVNYNDYDIVLSKNFISGSSKIEYIDDNLCDFFNYTDKRCYMFYSKSTHTLMVKFKEELNIDLFCLFLINICRFNYILKNKK
jgi:hypothetical protein